MTLIEIPWPIKLAQTMPGTLKILNGPWSSAKSFFSATLIMPMSGSSKVIQAMVVGSARHHVRNPKKKFQRMAERNLGARQQPGDGDADGKTDGNGQRPDEQRVAERGEQPRPLKRIHPVFDAPGARLDKPIGGGVEAVDQEQQHRPDEKVAERDQDHRHDEMTFRQTRGAAVARRDCNLIYGRGLVHGQLYRSRRSNSSNRSSRVSDRIAVLSASNDWNGLNDLNVLNGVPISVSTPRF